MWKISSMMKFYHGNQWVFGNVFCRKYIWLRRNVFWGLKCSIWVFYLCTCMLTHCQKCWTCVSLFRFFCQGLRCMEATYAPNFLLFPKHAASSDCHTFLIWVFCPQKASLSEPGVIPVFSSNFIQSKCHLPDSSWQSGFLIFLCPLHY